MQELDNSRRAWLLSSASIGLGVLSGCAAGPGGGAGLGALANSVAQDLADLGRIEQAGAGRMDIGNDELRRLVARAVPATPGPGREVGQLRRVFAAMLLGDAATVLAADPVTDDPRTSLPTRVLLLQARSSALQLAGNDRAGLAFLRRAEALALGDGSNRQQMVQLSPRLLQSIGVFVDSGLIASSQAMLARLPADLSGSGLPPMQDTIYRAERLRLSAHIAFRSGNYDEALAQARQAVAIMVRLGAPADADIRFHVMHRGAMMRSTLAMLASRAGRRGEAMEQARALAQIAQTEREPVFVHFAQRAAAEVAHANGDLVGAASIVASRPPLIWERNWPFIRAGSAVQAALMQAYAGRWAAASQALAGAGRLDDLPDHPLALSAAAVDGYLAVMTGQPVAPSAQRLRRLGPKVLAGFGPDTTMVYHGARVITSAAMAQATGLDGQWLDDAAQAGQQFRSALRQVRQSSLTIEFFVPAEAFQAVRQSLLLVMAYQFNRNKASLDALLQALALFQETELDAAVAAAAARRQPLPGLTAADLRALQDAQLAARQATQAHAFAVREQADSAVLATQAQQAVARLERLIDALDARSPGFGRRMQGGAPRADVLRSWLTDSDLVVSIAPLGRQTLVLAISRNDVRLRLQPLDDQALATSIGRLRQTAQMPAGGGSLPPFDVDAARTLYSQLFAGLDELMQRSNQLHVVASGVAAALPLGCLVRDTAVPATGRAQAVPWLVRSHAIQGVASLAHIAASAGQAGRWSRGLMSWADPAFTAPAASARPLGRGLVRPRPALPESDAVAAPPPDWQQVQWPRLARTVEEATELSRALGVVPDEAIVSGAAATRTSVLRASESGRLARAGVLHFATHGVAPGEIRALTQPALVMAAQGPDMDSQLLTLDDILSLQVQADLVLLSACNTASAARPGGDALSGLARGFLHAGARAVLATHWPVDDASAAQLVVRTITRAARQGQPLSRALQTAALDFIDGRQGTRPNWAHPAHWAAFILLGAAPT